MFWAHREGLPARQARHMAMREAVSKARRRQGPPQPRLRTRRTRFAGWTRRMANLRTCGAKSNTQFLSIALRRSVLRTILPSRAARTSAPSIPQTAGRKGLTISLSFPCAQLYHVHVHVAECICGIITHCLQFSRIQAVRSSKRHGAIKEFEADRGRQRYVRDGHPVAKQIYMACVSRGR